VKSRIRICIKVKSKIKIKIYELWKPKMEPRRLTLEPWRFTNGGLKVHHGAVREPVGHCLQSYVPYPFHE
jgi:hypothetical protein